MFNLAILLTVFIAFVNGEVYFSYSEVICALDKLGFIAENISATESIYSADSALWMCKVSDTSSKQNQSLLGSFSIQNISDTLYGFRQDFKTCSKEVLVAINFFQTFDLERTVNSIKNIDDCLSRVERKENSSAAMSASIHPKNCYQLKQMGKNDSGVYTIYIDDFPVNVQCDQETDGGGWTIVQSRKVLPQRENFNRTWFEYVLGFGDSSGEYWLGLEKIHRLTNSLLMELRFDMEDFEGNSAYASYSFIRVGDSSQTYILNIGKYFDGNAGDSLSYHNDKKFSTFDNDDGSNCAKSNGGGGWYDYCDMSSINGIPHEGYYDGDENGIEWEHFKPNKYSLKTIQMKIRPAYN